MRRPAGNAGTMPAFKSASEKRAWLLDQLAAVDKEAILEDVAAGRNERITIRLRNGFHLDVGDTSLYGGDDATAFCAALAKLIDALPLASAFMVEAGKGGKVLSGGVEESAGSDLGASPTPKRRSRAAKKATEA